MNRVKTCRAADGKCEGMFFVGWCCPSSALILGVEGGRTGIPVDLFAMFRVLMCGRQFYL